MGQAPGDGLRTRAARLSAMLDLLATRGRLSVSEAAAQLEVSDATVRRDFAELARRRLVNRSHGEVVATSVAYELPYRYRSRQADSALDRIAAAVAPMVRPGSVVAINGGTTTTATARAVTARDDLAGEGAAAELTLVTNALNIACEAVLRPRVQVVSVGGVARPESYEVSGPLAALVVEQLWFDLAIVGVNGLSADAGASCRFEDEAAIVRSMIQRAQQVIVVATGDKLGRRTFAAICPADQVTALVTTAGDENSEVAALRARGVDVRCV